MTRRRQFAPVAALAIVLGLMLAVPASAEPALTGYPSSMAVAGDSISRGYNADPAVPGESLARVWATGTEAAVSSHYSRILAANPAVAGRSYNDAQSGAGVLALNSQITSVNARGVDHVLILTGGNNACTTTEAGMLPVADFATNFQTAMNTLAGGSPNARVFVASIPDAHQLWALFKDDPNAVAVWNTYGICQSLLANPQSMAQEDVDRRARVRQRIVDFNAELARICGEVIHCRFDGNAVFNTVLTTADVAFDYFHPSLAGQAKLAAATWAATFDFSDQQAPSTTATTADVTGGLSLSLAATDDAACAASSIVSMEGHGRDTRDR